MNSRKPGRFGQSTQSVIAFSLKAVQSCCSNFYSEGPLIQWACRTSVYKIKRYLRKKYVILIFVRQLIECDSRTKKECLIVVTYQPWQMTIITKYVDKARLRKLVAANQFISRYSRNKIVTKSCFKVHIHTVCILMNIQ